MTRTPSPSWPLFSLQSDKSTAQWPIICSFQLLVAPACDTFSSSCTELNRGTTITKTLPFLKILETDKKKKTPNHLFPWHALLSFTCNPTWHSRLNVTIDGLLSWILRYRPRLSLNGFLDGLLRFLLSNGVSISSLGLYGRLLGGQLLLGLSSCAALDECLHSTHRSSGTTGLGE